MSQDAQKELQLLEVGVQTGGFRAIGFGVVVLLHEPFQGFVRGNRCFGFGTILKASFRVLAGLRDVL